MNGFLEPLDIGHQNKASIPFYSCLRRIIFFLPKTLTKQTEEQSVTGGRRWCSVSPIVSGTVMPPSPTNTGLSRPLVIHPIRNISFSDYAFDSNILFSISIRF